MRTRMWVILILATQLFADLKITSLGNGVNSRYDELAPVLSPDGNTLYFCREGHPDNVGVKTIVDGSSVLRDDQDIWVSRRRPDGTWGEAEHIDAPFNSRTYDFPIGTSADGRTLYIGNVYHKNGTVTPGVSKTRFRNGKWSFPEPLRIENFYNEANLVNYSLSADERTLILNLQRKDTVGRMDLYVSFLQPDDTWSEPLNLGKEINSAFMEVTPFLAADNKTLYFASNRPGGVGQFDMYMSRRLDNSWTHWTEPVNLGPKINTSGNDINYVIAPSGDYAIFASDTPGRGKDLYRIALPEEVRPEKSILVYGKVTGKDGKGMPGRVVFERLSDGALLARTETTEDGEFKIHLPRGEVYGVHAESDGYLPQSTTVDLGGESVREQKLELAMTPIISGAKMPINNIFFKKGSYQLSKESYAELNRLTRILKQYRGVRIEIGGHTDNTGDERSNMELSKNRARAVMDYLIEKGFPRNAIRAVGYGESRPVASNDTEEGRRRNRRVELTILEIEKERAR
ncbi:MAG: OmpA family protein [Turneriella sp.]|nr:OmpA family protein [Turneriella sp.]